MRLYPWPDPASSSSLRPPPSHTVFGTENFRVVLRHPPPRGSHLLPHPAFEVVLRRGVSKTAILEFGGCLTMRSFHELKPYFRIRFRDWRPASYQLRGLHATSAKSNFYLLVCIWHPSILYEYRLHWENETRPNVPCIECKWVYNIARPPP
jgi:hypothetical protein